MKIHDYVRNGDFEGVAAELSNGADINAIEEETGLTPYQCSFDNHNVDMMLYLVSHGAIPEFTMQNEEEKEEETELEKAVLEGDLEKTIQLLDEGADVSHHKKNGFGILSAAICGPAQPELIELLIERGAPVGDRNLDGESPLDVAYQKGRFDLLRLLLATGADPQIMEWTPLHYAIIRGSLEDVEQCLRDEADLTVRDDWERTPWLLSVYANEIDIAKLLIEKGASCNDVGYCGQTAWMDVISSNSSEMVRWLVEIGVDIEATDEFAQTALMEAAQQGRAECVKILLEAGARIDRTDYRNPHGIAPEGYIGRRAMEKASTLEVARIFIDAGEDLSSISAELRAELTGLEWEGELETTAEDYEAGKHRRFGTANPEKMEIPFWDAMVRSGAIAYRGRFQFDDKDYSEDCEPVWCFHRFGKSITELPDGRFIEIAGEHEDGYDPDFCIYNDVFVHHGEGKFDIYGYPREVFPPTDFHSATLVGKHIYIIGSLGYPEDRIVGLTPIYRLDCESLAIEEVETTGKNPGWISEHTTVYVPEEEKIVVSGGQVWTKQWGKYDLPKNKDRFELDIKTMKWSKIG